MCRSPPALGVESVRSLLASLQESVLWFGWKVDGSRSQMERRWNQMDLGALREDHDGSRAPFLTSRFGKPWFQKKEFVKQIVARSEQIFSSISRNRFLRERLRNIEFCVFSSPVFASPAGHFQNASIPPLFSCVRRLHQVCASHGNARMLHVAGTICNFLAHGFRTVSTIKATDTTPWFSDRLLGVC